jgi:hypothetical protein
VVKTKKAGIQLPDPMQKFADELTADFGELKRQGGAAIETVKSGYRKIKQAIAP